MTRPVHVNPTGQQPWPAWPCLLHGSLLHHHCCTQLCRDLVPENLASLDFPSHKLIISNSLWESGIGRGNSQKHSVFSDAKPGTIMEPCVLRYVLLSTYSTGRLLKPVRHICFYYSSTPLLLSSTQTSRIRHTGHCNWLLRHSQTAISFARMIRALHHEADTDEMLGIEPSKKKPRLVVHMHNSVIILRPTPWNRSKNSNQAPLVHFAIS